MVRRLSPAYPRTAAALLLTVAAVAAPFVSWYVSGTQHLAQQADLQQRSLLSDGSSKAVVHAEHLATRFEVLREAESRRPFYHYQSLFHDPKGASQGLSVSVSPLAQSPVDPLIEAHFQVDAKGHLTLPTVSEVYPDLGLQHDDEAHCQLLWRLKDVAVFCDIEADTGLVQDVVDLWNETLTEPIAAPVQPMDPFEHVSSENENVARDLYPSQNRPEILWLSTASWEQHLAANDLYADLKLGKGKAAIKPHLNPRMGAAKPLVRIHTAPLAWRTLPIGGELNLAAMRTVETPAGPWTQGFSIDAASVRLMLANASLPTTFEPRPARDDGPRRGIVSAPIHGTGWQVSVDLGTALDRLEAEQATGMRNFLRAFILGAAGAGLAGILLISMVFYSERLAQQRAQFAAAAAHELRTPLAGLRLYGEMLAEGLGDPSRSRDYARRLAGEAERLGRVVTNVLSFTRLERGGLRLNPQQGDLSGAVLEAFQRQRPALEEAGATIELDIENDLPATRFDRDAVHHIVQNLLDNAEKYTRDVENRRIRLILGRDAGEVVLAVVDNGRGIAKSLRRTLFRPFARGEQKDSPEGLGLGLVLVRMLAKAQGADIAYREADGGGAELRVSFPIAEPT